MVTLYIKKLFVFLILSLFLFNNGFSKNVKLICEDVENKGVFHILMINDKLKSLGVEQKPGIFNDTQILVYNNDEIGGNLLIKKDKQNIQKVIYSIDRRTGVLDLTNYFFEDGRTFTTNSNCELFIKNKF